MDSKLLTPEMEVALSKIQPEIIPQEFIHKAHQLGIKDIFILRNTKFQTIGLSCNAVVLLNNGRYIEHQIIPEKVEEIMRILTK